MNRSDWLWVVTRLLGVYLLAKAIMAIPAAFSGFVMVWAFWGEVRGDDTMGKMIQMTLYAGIGGVLQFIVFSLLAWYFLRGGKWFHRFISPQQGAAGVVPAPELQREGDLE
jgi:hypothetical protein